MASFLDTLFGGGAEKEAADKDRAALLQYQQQATQALQTGYATGTQNLNQAVGAYQPLADLGKTYGAGAPTLMGALGVGSPTDIALAQKSFTSSPSYDYTLSQGLQALARQRAVGGMGASGNADTDAIAYATNLSNQNYQQWINNLMQTGQMGVGATGAAAGGQAAGYTGLASLAKGYGEDVSGVYGNVTSGDISANNLQASGEAAGAKNLLGAGLSLASLALGPVGAGLGSSLSGLSSLAAGGFGGMMGNQWQLNNPGAWGSSYYGPAR